MRVETREERLERRRRERAEQVAYKLEQEIAVWDPAGIPNVTADPFKTLFVARIVSRFLISKYISFHVITLMKRFASPLCSCHVLFRTTIHLNRNLEGNSRYMVQ